MIAGCTLSARLQHGAEAPKPTLHPHHRPSVSASRRLAEPLTAEIRR